MKKWIILPIIFCLCLAGCTKKEEALSLNGTVWTGTQYFDDVYFELVDYPTSYYLEWTLTFNESTVMRHFWASPSVLSLVSEYGGFSDDIGTYTYAPPKLYLTFGPDIMPGTVSGNTMTLSINSSDNNDPWLILTKK